MTTRVCTTEDTQASLCGLLGERSTWCDKDRGATFREGGGGETSAGQETECMNPPSRGFRGGFNVNKSWSYGNGVASRFRQDSLTDQQDLGCGLIGSCFRPRTRPNMDESSRVLLVSILYPAGARRLSLRGQSARIQASLRAYPGGFPWVEPVVFKTSGGLVMCAKSRGIEFVRMLVALELYEIPREEVAGGAVGVVRGGFPWEGPQRVRFPEKYPNADSCSPNRVIVSYQVRHSHIGAQGHTQSVWDPHSGLINTIAHTPPYALSRPHLPNPSPAPPPPARLLHATRSVTTTTEDDGDLMPRLARTPFSLGGLTSPLGYLFV
ncbi:hypothetical protein DFH09DRAFT_1104286 [Mycena vulgaris]|nr:hypothetical protein DFH09DRAFT_1104286 [Mycena vulgaris]